MYILSIIYQQAMLTNLLLFLYCQCYCYISIVDFQREFSAYYLFNSYLYKIVFNIYISFEKYINIGIAWRQVETGLDLGVCF